MASSSSVVEKSPLHSKHTNVRGLFFFSLPLIMIAGSTAIPLFFITLCLARYSPEALRAYSIGHAFIFLFQIASIRMAVEAQVFVSRSCGEEKPEKVGPYIWQMIWLSLFSSALLTLVGVLLETVFFDSSSLQQSARGYFHLLILGHILFPLSTTLGTFYTGRKQLKVPLAGAVLLIAIHMILAAGCIHGVGSILPALGLKGAAWASILSQALYCFWMFALILRPKHRKEYGTNKWQLRPALFWETVRIGALNGLSAGVMTSFWTLLVKLLAHQGTDFLTILAIGNSCCEFFSFVNLGVGQAATIMLAGSIGARQWEEVWQTVRSAAVLMAGVLLFLFPFLILYPKSVLMLFFPDFSEKLSAELIDGLYFSCRAVWFCIAIFALDRLVRAVLTASGDTVYMLLIYLPCLSLGSCLPIYLAIAIWNFPAHTLWPLVFFTIVLRNVPLIFRIRQERWRNDFPLSTATA